jgi:hypothetical protein
MGARPGASTPATPSSPLRATTRCGRGLDLGPPPPTRRDSTPLDANDPDDQRRCSTSDARSSARPTMALDAGPAPPTRRDSTPIDANDGTGAEYCGRGCQSSNCDVPDTNEVSVANVVTPAFFDARYHWAPHRVNAPLSHPQPPGVLNFLYSLHSGSNPPSFPLAQVPIEKSGHRFC